MAIWARILLTGIFVLLFVGMPLMMVAPNQRVQRVGEAVCFGGALAGGIGFLWGIWS